MDHPLTLFMVPLLVLISCTELSARKLCSTSCVCISGFVSCSRLSSFPDSLPSDTQSLSLSEVHFPEISSDALTKLFRINTIRFENCTIGTIRDGAFRNLSSIQKISFSFCSVRVIETGAFHYIRNVSTIMFYKMSIGRIETHAFNNIRGLKLWTLFKSDVGEIEAEAFHQLSHIYSFSIYSNQIGRLGRAVFSSMGNIKHVDFFMNNVDDIGCNVFDFSTNEFSNFEFYANVFSCDCKLFGLSRGRQAINFSSSAKRDSPLTNKVTPTKRAADVIDSGVNTVSAKKWSFDALLYRNWCIFAKLKHKVSLENYRYTDEVECETNACFPQKSKDVIINRMDQDSATSSPKVPPSYVTKNNASGQQSMHAILLLLSLTILTFFA